MHQQYEALNRGLSQTPYWIADRAWTTPLLRFVNLFGDDATVSLPTLVA